MNIRTSLMALTASAALVLVGACDKPTDEPVVTTPPTTTATMSPATPVPSTSSSKTADPDGSEPANKVDSGLDACDKIMDNIRGQKLPLPVNEKPQYYVDFKKQFTGSKYPEIKDAGEKFIDKYEAAIKAGGEQPDANELSDAAADLVKACQKEM